MQSDRQERISERAYHIWLAEGRVDGRHEEHWRQAEHEIAEEEIRHAAALAERASRTGATARRPNRAASAASKTAGAAAKGKSRTTPAARRGQRAPNGPSV